MIVMGSNGKFFDVQDVKDMRPFPIRDTHVFYLNKPVISWLVESTIKWAKADPWLSGWFEDWSEMP